jgi:hypothetical protein
LANNNIILAELIVSCHKKNYASPSSERKEKFIHPENKIAAEQPQE